MTYLNTQSLSGIFTLITLILAVAAVGRLLGLDMGEALYLATLLVAGLLRLAYYFAGRKRNQRKA
ncbi:MAG: hypothetical protein H6672_08625 [Anaerolineaceae bacterium]|nr:hypothetical protein [Anaerolineaceae bacterium]